MKFESLDNILSLSCTINYTFDKTDINAFDVSFDLITPSNSFELKRINSLQIIETSLLKTLQNSPSFYLKPKTGYCAIYKNESVILVMESEQKANKLNFIGM
jgi:hypothetical protein